MCTIKYLHNYPEHTKTYSGTNKNKKHRYSICNKSRLILHWKIHTVYDTLGVLILVAVGLAA